jgi:hypothetical protein
MSDVCLHGGGGDEPRGCAFVVEEEIAVTDAPEISKRLSPLSFLPSLSHFSSKKAPQQRTLIPPLPTRHPSASSLTLLRDQADSHLTPGPQYTSPSRGAKTSLLLALQLSLLATMGLFDSVFRFLCDRVSCRMHPRWTGTGAVGPPARVSRRVLGRGRCRRRRSFARAPARRRVTPAAAAFASFARTR